MAITILSLALLLLLNTGFYCLATMKEPFTAQMKDSNGFQSGVSGIAEAWATPSVSGGTAFYLDLTKSANFFIDLSGVTHLGNPTGASIYFTSYVTEYPVQYRFAIKQNSGNTGSVAWTGVSLYTVATESGTGVSMCAPSGANKISFFEVLSGIDGTRGASGTSMWPISGVTK